LSGGFHNVAPITLRVDSKAALTVEEEMERNERLGDYIIRGEVLDDILTPWQRRRLEGHFCGIQGCCCGSYWRDCIVESIK